jgi:hypothetical protein
MARWPARIILAGIAALLIASCTSEAAPSDLVGGSPEADAEDDGPEDAGETDAASSCDRDQLADEPLIELTGGDPAELAAQVAAVTHACAPVVVLADAEDPWAASLAAPVARSLDAPLLLDAGNDDALSSTLSSLDTEELVTVGPVAASGQLPRTELESARTDPQEEPEASQAEPDRENLAPGSDRVALAVDVAEYLGTERFLALDEDDHDLRGAALARLEADVALLPLPMADLVAAAEQLPPGSRVEVLAGTATAAGQIADELIAAGIDADAADVGNDPWPPAGADTWLVDPTEGAITAVGAVAASGRDESLLPIHLDDPRSDRDRTTRIREAGAERHVVLGDLDDDARWKLDTVLDGQALPWGGFRLFEDERMVALYGSVEFEELGALGEQGLDATVDRLRTVTEPYAADGARVLPAFELITTIASASAEPTGDYSRRTPIELLRPWVARAAEEELYVILDLQPGRTDFLTQAKEYEELLLEPHVGLALDPEWRLEPDQVHLRQIGSVSAEEVQEVADWLAELTREHQLPEKLLVLHQFRFSMLPDRDTIVAPSELAVVVHMDGQGPLGAKYETYGALTTGAEDRWLWGWKNFYDEDLPTPTPEQVLDLDPLPVFVTYQ